MADINQVITLGIGRPASIPHFILLGLSPSWIGWIRVNLYERYFASGTLWSRPG